MNFNHLDFGPHSYGKENDWKKTWSIFLNIILNIFQKEQKSFKPSLRSKIKGRGALAYSAADAFGNCLPTAPLNTVLAPLTEPLSSETEYIQLIFHQLPGRRPEICKGAKW